MTWEKGEGKRALDKVVKYRHQCDIMLDRNICYAMEGGFATLQKRHSSTVKSNK
jgi:hypothetical protein